MTSPLRRLALACRGAAWRGLGLALVGLALAGCETVRGVEVDASGLAAALAGRTEPQAPLSGRVALMMAPAVLGHEVTGERLHASMPTRLQWPAGRLVEAALVGALAQRFSDGAVRLDTPPDAGFAATVRVTEVTLHDDQSLRYFIPVPLPGVLFISGYDASVQLGFELQMLDPLGRALWTRRYDSGRVVWQRHLKSPEQAPEGLVRMAHEAVAQLALQAAHDVRAWVEAERLKPRQF